MIVNNTGRSIIHLATVILAGTLLTGCASGGSVSSPSASTNGAVSRITSCKSTDRQVASNTQCLQDDAACYQISNGSWCTGERGNTCPAGSTVVPPGARCPEGKRCFKFSESLECTI